MVLERDLQILAHAERGEDAGHLELDAHAAADALERLERGDVLAGEEDLPARWLVLAEDQAEEGALAGAIGADEAVDLAGLRP